MKPLLPADDLTPNPEGVPTAFEMVRRLNKLEREVSELKQNYGHHHEELIEHDDRLDAHDRHLDDMKALIVSHQTTNGLVLQSIDRRLKEMVEEMRSMKRPIAVEPTVLTPVPHE